MSWIGMINELAEVGLSEAKLIEAVNESPEVKAEVIRVAEETKLTWLSVWDEMGPHPHETGKYRESITVTYETSKSGEFTAKVGSKRQDAHWLEYGTSKMKEFAPAQKTIERMNGELSGHTSQKAGGGNVGSVGA